MQFGLSDRTVKTLFGIFAKYPIERVIIYGSRAMNNYKNGSDIDLTFKTCKNFTFKDFLRLNADIDDSDIPYLVDTSIYDKLSDESLKSHIERHGKIFYGNLY